MRFAQEALVLSCVVAAARWVVELPPEQRDIAVEKLKEALAMLDKIRANPQDNTEPKL